MESSPFRGRRGHAGPVDREGSEGVDPVGPGSGRHELETVLLATRRLLWVSDPKEAAVVACDLAESLGGRLVAAEADHGQAVPVNLALGTGPPVLPTAAPGSAARAALEQHLPGFVRDAYRVLELLERSGRLAEEASRDPLTGLWNRRTVARLLPRVRPGATLVALDIDHFKQVNDTFGHDRGDDVLRAFAHALMSTARGVDQVARLGGEEFLTVLEDGEAEPFLERLTRHWRATRPYDVTFSAGVARVAGEGRLALAAADRALYRAKRSGRDRWCWATEEEYS